MVNSTTSDWLSINPPKRNSISGNRRQQFLKGLFKTKQDIIAVQLVVLSFILTFYSLILIPRFRTADPASSDFFKFYQSARFYLDGKAIYTPIPYTPSDKLLESLTDQGRKSIRTLHPNLNSPLHTLVTVPFAFLPFRTAIWLWSLFSLAAGLMAAYLLVKYIGCKESGVEMLLGMWIVLLGYFPSLVNMALGQFGFIVMLCSVLLWVYARKERMLSAGIVLGLSICLKSFFGLFLIFFAVQRRWRTVTIAIVTYVVANIFGLMIFGVDNYHQYIANHALAPFYINASWNASITAFYGRIFQGSYHIPLISAPILGYSIIYGLLLVITTVLVWTAWPHQDKVPMFRFDIGFSLCVVAMLLISPYAWIYYFPCLMVPFVVCWRTASWLPARKICQAVIIGIWILSTWPTGLISSESAKWSNPIIWLTLAGCYYYAIQGLFIFLTNLAFQYDCAEDHIMSNSWRTRANRESKTPQLN